MASVPPVAIHFHAHTAQAQAAMTQLQTSLGGVGGAADKTRLTLGGMMHNFKNIGVGVAAITAVHKAFQTLTDTIKSTVQVNADFEASMSHVKAVSEQNVGFTIAQFKEMTAEARRLGSTTRFSAVEAAEGLKFLSMAGLSAKESTQALESTLRLAQAGALELGTAADIVTNIMTAFGASFQDTDRFVNVLAKAAANANTDVEQLAMGMKFVAPIASGLGRSLEETTAAMMTLSNAGIQSAMSGTGLRMLLSTLSKENGRTVRELEALGLKFEDFDPSSNSLVDTLNELRKVSDLPDGASKFMAAFTQRSGAAALVLGKLVDDVEGFERILKDSEGAADQMAQTMDDNLKGAVVLLVSAFKELQLQLGKSGINDALRDVVNGVTEFLNTLNQEGGAASFGRDIAVGLRSVASILGTISKPFIGVIKIIHELRHALKGIVVGFMAVKLASKISAMQMSLDSKKNIANAKRTAAVVKAQALAMRRAIQGIIGGAVIGAALMIIEGFIGRAQRRLMTLQELGQGTQDTFEFTGQISSGLKNAQSEEELNSLKEQIQLRRTQIEQERERLLEQTSNSEVEADIERSYRQQVKTMTILENLIDREGAAIVEKAKAAQRVRDTLSEWNDELAEAAENSDTLLTNMEKADLAAAEKKAKVDAGDDETLEAELLLMVHGLEDLDEARDELQALKDKADEAQQFGDLSQEDLNAEMKARFAGLSAADKKELDPTGNLDEHQLQKKFVEGLLVSEGEVERASMLHGLIEKIQTLQRKGREDEIKAANEKVNKQKELDMDKAIMKAKVAGDKDEVKRLERQRAIKQKTAELEKKGIADAAKQAEELVDMQAKVDQLKDDPKMMQSGAVAGAINTIMGRTTEAQIAAETGKTRTAAEKTAIESELTRKAIEEMNKLLGSQGRFT